MIDKNSHIWKEYLLNQITLERCDKDVINKNLKDNFDNYLEHCSWEIIDKLVYIHHHLNNQFFIFTEKYIRELVEHYKLKDINELMNKWCENKVELNLKWY